MHNGHTKVHETKHAGRKKSSVSETTHDLLNDGKKLMNELYEEGLEKVNETEQQVKEYTDELLGTIQRNPLTSVLVAGAIGILISRLLK